ncbi:hypothetical protein [Methylobacterium sp. 1030]|uniref:hypothetical protein n=1 Tax=Methylobacterium sp. 1030 TaxID=3156404 RepID=UPI0033921850
MPRKSVQARANETATAALRPIQILHSDETSAFSVPEFCARNKIGESSYFYLKAIGRAPKSTRVGRRVIIFPQDEAAWRQSIQDNPLPASLRRAAEAVAKKEAA